MRWAVWHTAALPNMTRFPKAAAFIDPPKRGPKPRMTAAEIFHAGRSWDKAPAPAWVLERFRNP